MAIYLILMSGAGFLFLCAMIEIALIIWL